MNTYKVEVTEYGEKQADDRYPPSKTLYTQSVDTLDLAALIAVVNGLVKQPVTQEVKHE